MNNNIEVIVSHSLSLSMCVFACFIVAFEDMLQGSRKEIEQLFRTGRRE